MTAADTARTAGADSRRSAPELLRKAGAITLGILAALAFTFLLFYLMLGTSGRASLVEGGADDVVQPASLDEAASVEVAAIATWSA